MNNPYIQNQHNPERYGILYTNSFEFNGRLLSFRKKELFDITDEIPKHIKFLETHWNVNRKQLTVKRAKELITNEQVYKNIDSLQWYQQEQLNHVFNL